MPRALSLRARVALACGALSLATMAGCGCPVPVPSVDVSGADPVFSWSGDDAYQLIVSGEAGVDWSIQCSTGQNCISPPLTYGELPADAIENAAERALARGSHTVTVCSLCGDAPKCSDPLAFDVE